MTIPDHQISDLNIIVLYRVRPSAIFGRKTIGGAASRDLLANVPKCPREKQKKRVRRRIGRNVTPSRWRSLDLCSF
jgi:hypothetical protein